MASLTKVSKANKTPSFCPRRTLNRTADCENILRMAEAVSTKVRITVHETVL
jgi:hypothetical protein